MESRLAKELNDKLKRDSRTAKAPIEALDNNGIVTLVGTVDCHKARMAALLIANNHPGVLRVVNEIALDDPEATTELDAVWPLPYDIAYPN